MEKIYLDKRFTVNGKKSHLYLDNFLDLYGYIALVFNDINARQFIFRNGLTSSTSLQQTEIDLGGDLVMNTILDGLGTWNFNFKNLNVFETNSIVNRQVSTNNTSISSTFGNGYSLLLGDIVDPISNSNRNAGLFYTFQRLSTPTAGYNFAGLYLEETTGLPQIRLFAESNDNGESNTKGLFTNDSGVWVTQTSNDTSYIYESVNRQDMSNTIRCSREDVSTGIIEFNEIQLPYSDNIIISSDIGSYSIPRNTPNVGDRLVCNTVGSLSFEQDSLSLPCEIVKHNVQIVNGNKNLVIIPSLNNYTNLHSLDVAVINSTAGNSIQIEVKNLTNNLPITTISYSLTGISNVQNIPINIAIPSNIIVSVEVVSITGVNYGMYCNLNLTK